ncbi:hypothetical protein ACFXA0_31100 [Streptomyces cyaneofuscatus]|uniref:hypothetical protein n=1 Tax=Streptomyces cyaneofuscatus TaxID=66883 RepID=UPI0036C92201
MLRHAIAPSSGWTKAPHTVVRSRRMNSDAKILLLYVQGLPDSATDHPLGELARKLDMKGRSYQQAKKQLTEHGYLHEWRSQGDGGRWMTEQLLSSTPLTRDEAGTARAKLSPEKGQLTRPEQSPCPPPGAQLPTVGEPTSRPVGGYEPEEEHDEKNNPPDQPTEPAASKSAPEPELAGDLDGEAPLPSPQLWRAERVLLSLRHSRRELLLGVGEARVLAGRAARWLERGVTESDLRHALLAELPKEGVRSAFGFLGHRLTHKCPVPPAPATAAPAGPRPDRMHGYGYRRGGAPLPAAGRRDGVCGVPPGDGVRELDGRHGHVRLPARHDLAPTRRGGGEGGRATGQDGLRAGAGPG